MKGARRMNTKRWMRIGLLGLAVLVVGSVASATHEQSPYCDEFDAMVPNVGVRTHHRFGLGGACYQSSPVNRHEGSVVGFCYEEHAACEA
jgi:hypothetical protein